MLLKIETQRLVLHKNQNRNNLSRLFHLPPNRMPKIKINNQFNKMNNLKLLSFNENQNHTSNSLYIY